MQSVGRPGGGRSGARALGALIAMALLPICVIAAAPAGAQDEPISETITVTGRGWGHGRGLGQWGAFGYATGRSGGPWSYRPILDPYYRDTDLSSLATPPAAVTPPAQRGRRPLVDSTAGAPPPSPPDPTDPPHPAQG